MATPKGAKVSVEEKVQLILFVKPPNAPEQEVGCVDAKDQDSVDWISGLADQFKEGGSAHRLIERTTKVRTQITEKELT